MRLMRLLALAALIFLPSPDSPRAEEKTPDHVLASVYVVNGGSCSGTIISRGTVSGLGVSAGHCFAGNIGGTFWICYPDGSKTTAELLALDRSKDLALFKVASSSILATAPVAAEMPNAPQYEICGYPDGKGPTFLEVAPSKQGLVSIGDPQSCVGGICLTRKRWEFELRNGNAFPGSSGCGVFANGSLCGVLSQSNWERDRRTKQLTPTSGRTCYTCTRNQLVDFLKAHDPKDCGNWLIPTPAPIVPKRTADIAPPPPNWEPTPNVPIRIKAREHNPKREDLNADHRLMAEEIDRLRQQLEALQSRPPAEPQHEVKVDLGEAKPLKDEEPKPGQPLLSVAAFAAVLSIGAIHRARAS